MRLSRRAATVDALNLISRTRAELEDAGVALLELSDSNPTRHGLLDPEVSETLARAAAATTGYDPSPRGPVAAREALAERFGGGPDDYWLTAGTSDAYGWLFTLLTDPGETVAVPQPGYPLLEPLGRLGGTGLRHYPSYYLHPHGWEYDLDALASVLRHPSNRVLVVVNPNNPTGTYAAQADELVARCQEHGAALIADEVFAPFPLDITPNPASLAWMGEESAVSASEGTSRHALVTNVCPGGEESAVRMGDDTPLNPSSAVPEADAVSATGADTPLPPLSAVLEVGTMSAAGAAASRPTAASPLPRLAGTSDVLTFGLDGVSKLLAAPHLKLGWIRLSGPPSEVARVAPVLDQIADAYLPVSGPTAAALPQLLTLADASIARIRTRLSTNLAAAHAILGGADFRVRHTGGGWMVLVDVPRVLPDDDLIIALMRSASLAVQPGWFYDLDDRGTLALSLLPADLPHRCELLLQAISALA